MKDSGSIRLLATGELTGSENGWRGNAATCTEPLSRPPLAGQRYGETPYKAGSLAVSSLRDRVSLRPVQLYESTDGLTREQLEQAPYFFVWLHGMGNGPIAPKNLQRMQARLKHRVIFMAFRSHYAAVAPVALHECRFLQPKSRTTNPVSMPGSSKPGREERAPLRLGLLLLQDPEQESARPESSPPSFHS